VSDVEKTRVSYLSTRHETMWLRERVAGLRVAVAVPDGNRLDPLFLDLQQYGARESTKQGRVDPKLVGW
jgi:hypothetical protein